MVVERKKIALEFGMEDTYVEYTKMETTRSL